MTPVKNTLFMQRGENMIEATVEKRINEFFKNLEKEFGSNVLDPWSWMEKYFIRQKELRIQRELLETLHLYDTKVMIVPTSVIIEVETDYFDNDMITRIKEIVQNVLFVTFTRTAFSVSTKQTIAGPKLVLEIHFYYG